MDPSRAAKALPAGPVPPRIPMRISAQPSTRPSSFPCSRLRSGGMGLLDGKNVVVTGVLTDDSLAFGVAKLAQEQGAQIVLTGAGRALSLTKRTARKLPTEPEVFELDVTVAEHLDAVRDALASQWGRVDGVLHSIGFAPAACLGDDFMAATWDDVATAIHVSTYSLKALAEAFVPLM